MFKRAEKVCESGAGREATPAALVSAASAVPVLVAQASAELGEAELVWAVG